MSAAIEGQTITVCPSIAYEHQSFSATSRAIWLGIVRTSRSWSTQSRDRGDSQRKRQHYPAQHD
jgi:hypothetical protein